MKYIFLIATILISLPGTAQNLFTKFIIDKNIDWAISSEENIHCDRFDLNLFLRQQLDQQKIKAAVIDDFELLQSIQYTNKEAIIKKVDPSIDSYENISNPLFNEKFFHKETASLVEAYQVLYVEKGILKSVVNTVSPKHAVITKNNTYLGLSNLFSTGFNTNRKLKKSIIKNSIPVASSSIDILPKADRSRFQKSLFNKDLLTAIWPYLGKEYKLLRLDSMKYITKKELEDAYFHPSARVEVPEYDEEGKLVRTKIVIPFVSPELFSRISVQQEWMYNKRKNLLINKINSLTLSYKTTDDREIAVLKIIPQ